MKILNEHYKDEELTFSAFDTYFKSKKYAVFDIETTGLSPSDSQIILSGFVLPEGNGSFKMTQFFATDISEEREVIEATYNVLSELDYVITFNGMSFDIPFLEKRMKALGMDVSIKPSQMYNLDVYRIVRKFSGIKQFVPNLKQKTLENFMGLGTREDTIDGGASVELYYDYVKTKNEKLEKTILLHNSDDVKQLHRLCGILKKTDLHQGLSCFGFPYSGTKVEKVEISKGFLNVTGKTSLPDYIRYDDISNVNLNIVHNNLTLKLKLNEKEGLLFTDLSKIADKPEDINFFRNCNGLYLDHFLMLSADGKTNFHAANLLTMFLLSKAEELEDDSQQLELQF